MNVQPLKNRIILKRVIVEQKSAGGIILKAAENQTTHHSPYANVIAVGPEVKEVKVGDRVLIPGWNKADIQIEGQDYICMEENDIIGIMLSNG